MDAKLLDLRWTIQNVKTLSVMRRSEILFNWLQYCLFTVCINLKIYLIVVNVARHILKGQCRSINLILLLHCFTPLARWCKVGLGLQHRKTPSPVLSHLLTVDCQLFKRNIFKWWTMTPFKYSVPYISFCFSRI